MISGLLIRKVHKFYDIFLETLRQVLILQFEIYAGFNGDAVKKGTPQPAVFQLLWRETL